MKTPVNPCTTSTLSPAFYSACNIVCAQPWPAELPLIKMGAGGNGADAEDELDMGVVVYSCSFAVISLMILSQVRFLGNEVDWCRVHARARINH